MIYMLGLLSHFSFFFYFSSFFFHVPPLYLSFIFHIYLSSYSTSAIPFYYSSTSNSSLPIGPYLTGRATINIPRRSSDFVGTTLTQSTTINNQNIFRVISNSETPRIPIPSLTAQPRPSPLTIIMVNKQVGIGIGANHQSPRTTPSTSINIKR
jgi:hypothetical protein